MASAPAGASEADRNTSEGNVRLRMGRKQGDSLRPQTGVTPNAQLAPGAIRLNRFASMPRAHSRRTTFTRRAVLAAIAFTFAAAAQEPPQPNATVAVAAASDLDPLEHPEDIVDYVLAA